MKYSQFNNPNDIFNKKRLVEAVLTRALDKEEEIDTPPLVAQVVLSLTNQLYLLRILDPQIKLTMYHDIGDILMKEFKINPAELGKEGLAKKDNDNLARVIKQHEKLQRSNDKICKNIMSTSSLHECRRLLEQIEWGLKNHLIVAPEWVPTEDIVRTAWLIGGYSFYPVFSSKLVPRYFDAHGFKAALQSSIKTHKKGINKKVVVYISDAHHSDIVYADLLNLIISYPDER